MVTSTILDILLRHAGRHPAMQAQDIYKLLHQAALGSEHAVSDEEAARNLLERELTDMGDGPDDPQLDPISPDGQIVRVHLRPYLRMGKDPETLLQAFIRTANEWHGSQDNLKEYGAVAVELAHSGTGAIQTEEIKAFFAKMEAQDFPAVHYSEEYNRLYRPAYRVIARKLMEKK